MSDAIGRLASTLAEYEKAASAVAGLEAKLARAISDEESSAGDSSLSEEQSISAVAEAQSRKSVYSVRLASRQKVVATLSAELTSTINDAQGELRSLVIKEDARRREIIGARMLAAGDLQPGLRLQPLLEELLNYSVPVERLRALMPQPMVSKLEDAGLVHLVKDTLAKFEGVIAAAGETI
jgi:hypothetical protein